MLLVQEYLLSHSFGELIKDHGIYASFSKSGHKFSLNYDMLEAKDPDPLAQECRGLILSRDSGISMLSETIEVDGKLKYDHIIPGATRVLAYPMKRFFNLGQGSAAEIDWSDHKLAILKKLDGTLTIVGYDKYINKWCVATRSCPEADIPLDNGLYTFRTLFEKALKETNGMTFEEFTNKLDKNITYCFELCTPFNRVVVNYKENRITLIAARLIYRDGIWEDFRELDIDYVPTYGVPHVQAYTFTCVNDLLNWVSNQNPLEHEGVVVRDSKFNRLKVKNAAYVAFNKARDILGTSARNCLELVLSNKQDDVIPALPPEIVDRIRDIQNGVICMMRDYDTSYKAFRYAADKINPGNKKEFALLITPYKSIWSAPLFYMWEGRAENMKDFIMKNRKEGTWSDSFLDKILSIINQYNYPM